MSSYSMPALHFHLVSRTLLLANNYGRPITMAESNYLNQLMLVLKLISKHQKKELY